MLCNSFHSILCSPVCIPCPAVRAEEKRFCRVAESPAVVVQQPFHFRSTDSLVMAKIALVGS